MSRNSKAERDARRSARPAAAQTSTGAARSSAGAAGAAGAFAGAAGAFAGGGAAFAGGEPASHGAGGASDGAAGAGVLGSDAGSVGTDGGARRFSSSDGASGPERASEAAVADAAHAAMATAVRLFAAGVRPAAQTCATDLTDGVFDARPRAVDVAAARILQDGLTAAWARGWLPEDVDQIVRRRGSEGTAELVVDAIAADALRFDPSTIDPRWQAQLEQLGARQWWDGADPHLGQWVRRHSVDRLIALWKVITLAALLTTLPTLPTIVPRPGSARASSRAHRGVDEKMLARVRALLAKAESTEYGPEAESLSAKAQELMSRYAIEQAMLESTADQVALPGARRVWLDPPYLHPKSSLVGAVAAANHCRAVASLDVGFVTLVGDELDLQLVELLATSLMVQATTAVVAAGRHTGSYGQSRTRSFRHSFLIAYAGRIGERLRAQADETAAAAGTGLVPVFAERERLVDETLDTMFPSMRRKSVSVGNAAGWRAGRAAADTAVIQAGRAALPG